METLFKISMDVSPIFTQSVNFKVFQMLVKERIALYSQACEPKEIAFTTDELNAMRYVCGFVPFSLLRKYESGRNTFTQFFFLKIYLDSNVNILKMLLALLFRQGGIINNFRTNLSLVSAVAPYWIKGR